MMSKKVTDIVLISGWGLSSRIWQPLLAEFSISPQRLIEAYPPNVCTQLEQWADELAKSLVAEASSPICLIGFSLGAMLALAIAHRIPQSISHLVLLSASPKFVNQDDSHSWSHGLEASVNKKFIDDFSTHPVGTLQRFIALQAVGEAQSRTARQLLQQCLLDPHEYFPRLANALKILHQADLRTQCAEITCPTLLIHGARDQIMPIGAAQWLAQTLPNATLKIIESSGHAPQCTHAGTIATWINEHVSQ